MAQYIYGLLHGVDEKSRIIAMKDKHKVSFYYMAKGLFQSFMQYFQEGIYVFLYVSEDTKKYKGYTVKTVVSIEKVLSPNKQNPTVYYDISIIKSGISSIVNQPKYKCFLDFEMSMPPYKNYETFISEIIQVGLVLTDSDGFKIDEVNRFIQPILFRDISERTKRFLSISQEDINQGITYDEFYRYFQKMLKEYKPMVVVWGQNDQIELRKMNKIHNLPDFTSKTQFIDLLKLHKTYYGLKNDLGLFNAHSLYKDIDLTKQKHNAHEDAFVTKEVFFSFRDVCNGIRQVELTNTIEKANEV